MLPNNLIKDSNSGNTVENDYFCYSCGRLYHSKDTPLIHAKFNNEGEKEENYYYCSVCNSECVEIIESCSINDNRVQQSEREEDSREAILSSSAVKPSISLNQKEPSTQQPRFLHFDPRADVDDNDNNDIQNVLDLDINNSKCNEKIIIERKIDYYCHRCNCLRHQDTSLIVNNKRDINELHCSVCKSECVEIIENEEQRQNVLSLMREDERGGRDETSERDNIDHFQQSLSSNFFDHVINSALNDSNDFSNIFGSNEITSRRAFHRHSNSSEIIREGNLAVLILTKRPDGTDRRVMAALARAGVAADSLIATVRRAVQEYQRVHQDDDMRIEVTDNNIGNIISNSGSINGTNDINTHSSLSFTSEDQFSSDSNPFSAIRLPQSSSLLSATSSNTILSSSRGELRFGRGIITILTQRSDGAILQKMKAEAPLGAVSKALIMSVRRAITEISRLHDPNIRVEEMFYNGNTIGKTYNNIRGRNNINNARIDSNIHSTYNQDPFFTSSNSFANDSPLSSSSAILPPSNVSLNNTSSTAASIFANSNDNSRLDRTLFTIQTHGPNGILYKKMTVLTLQGALEMSVRSEITQILRLHNRDIKVEEKFFNNSNTISNNGNNASRKSNFPFTSNNDFNLVFKNPFFANSPPHSSTISSDNSSEGLRHQGVMVTIQTLQPDGAVKQIMTVTAEADEAAKALEKAVKNKLQKIPNHCLATSTITVFTNPLDRFNSRRELTNNHRRNNINHRFFNLTSLSNAHRGRANVSLGLRLNSDRYDRNLFSLLEQSTNELFDSIESFHQNPTSQDVINSLPIIKGYSVDLDDNIYENNDQKDDEQEALTIDECPVCQEEFSYHSESSHSSSLINETVSKISKKNNGDGVSVNDEVILTRLPCCHYFHRECIISWLRRSQTCPLCRRKVTKMSNTTNKT